MLIMLVLLETGDWRLEMKLRHAAQRRHHPVPWLPLSRSVHYVHIRPTAHTRSRFTFAGFLPESPSLPLRYLPHPRIFDPSLLLPMSSFP